MERTSRNKQHGAEGTGAEEVIVWNCGMKLRVVEGAAKGQTYSLDSPRVTIGRAQTNSVRTVDKVFLNDQTVSGVQAEMHWLEDKKTFLLINRSTTNPTQVNDQPIESVELAPGDQIRMGLCVLDLQAADYRFGGRPDGPPPGLRDSSRVASVPVELPTARTVDLPAQESTVKVQRLAALTTRPAYRIEVLSGPQQGWNFPITGLVLALGGPLDPDEPPLPKDKKWFDQDIPLGDSSIPPRCLALSWKELQNGFELRPVGVHYEVTVGRRASGFDWSAKLGNEPGLIIADDVLLLGGNLLRISLEPS